VHAPKYHDWIFQGIPIGFSHGLEGSIRTNIQQFIERLIKHKPEPAMMPKAAGKPTS
jgi:hypothetical protein